MKTLAELKNERADLAKEADNLDSQIEELEDEKHGIEQQIGEIDEQIKALDQQLAYAKHDGLAEIVHVTITPEMQEIAVQARGKSWDELREINARYERIAVQHAVVAEVGV